MQRTRGWFVARASLNKGRGLPAPLGLRLCPTIGAPCGWVGGLLQRTTPWFVATAPRPTRHTSVPHHRHALWVGREALATNHPLVRCKGSLPHSVYARAPPWARPAGGSGGFCNEPPPGSLQGPPRPTRHTPMPRHGHALRVGRGPLQRNTLPNGCI